MVGGLSIAFLHLCARVVARVCVAQRERGRNCATSEWRATSSVKEEKFTNTKPVSDRTSPLNDAPSRTNEIFLSPLFLEQPGASYLANAIAWFTVGADGRRTDNGENGDHNVTFLGNASGVVNVSFSLPLMTGCMVLQKRPEPREKTRRTVVRECCGGPRSG